MTPPVFLAFLGIVLGGVALAVQAPLNAVLARAFENPLLAAAVSFGVGFGVLAILCAVRAPWPAPMALPAVPWWAWTGGLLGAFYVTAAIWSVPVLGVVTTVAALVLGQMAGALALDAIGAFGLPVHAVTWQRLVAVALVVGGLILSQSG